MVFHSTAASRKTLHPREEKIQQNYLPKVLCQNDHNDHIPIITMDLIICSRLNKQVIESKTVAFRGSNRS